MMEPTGIGLHLIENSGGAVSGIIDLLCKQHKLSAVAAYMLCLVSGDLRTNEIVGMPNWDVSVICALFGRGASGGQAVGFGGDGTV